VDTWEDDLAPPRAEFVEKVEYRFAIVEVVVRMTVGKVLLSLGTPATRNFRQSLAGIQKGS
jgi:hypothetical protein